MSFVEITESRGWTHLVNSVATKNKQELESEKEQDYQGTSGKYLFFSRRKEDLVELGSLILTEFDLYCAKVSSESESGTYVLCIYDFFPRYRQVLKRLESDRISYRYWKSNRRTIEQAQNSSYAGV